jgi:hypothetical protein
MRAQEQPLHAKKAPPAAEAERARTQVLNSLASHVQMLSLTGMSKKKKD